MNPKLFNPDYLLHLCQKYNLHPSKKYGQNFLLEPEMVGDMVAAAAVDKNDTIVEVGPGFGVLTFALVEKAKKVIAFEIEKTIKPYWDEENKKCGNLEMVWGNILKEFSIFNFPIAGSQPVFSIPEYKVVANLPYQITSNVIRTFLELQNPPSIMVLMVQKEVAERICAKPGGMSLLSVAVQYYADAEIIASVPRSLFWPEPAVDSAVIKIVPHVVPSSPIVIPVKTGIQSPVTERLDSRLRGNDSEKFFNLVKAGFAQKRKLLIKNLFPIVGKEKKDLLKSAFAQLGIDEKARAQELSVEQWKEIVTLLHC